ncbi:hypothetical protein PLEOSDRAFT_1096759 [Pleurotus ostreatus PC15]|uniref:F-box domain-containing protein n=1 Tax=Pleurotus ostreatus (strain PC15) TaxID=1137138 RepID=A0A067NJN2_PLEO1|nr:hypothetical protein PLEOSDRAFT_1096759 [Pleurotus ostreatus PC15]
MPLDKLPSELLLSVASFLPQTDALALSRTSRKMHAIAEIQLYATVELEMGQPTAQSGDDPLNSFYANLMVKHERPLANRDLILVHAIIDALPCLRTMLLTHRALDFSVDVAPVPSHSLPSHRAMLKTLSRALQLVMPAHRPKATPPPFAYIANGLPHRHSPRLDLTWFNRTPFNTPFFIAFVSLHPHIRALYLPQCFNRNFPRVDASILPNLESIHAHFAVVLALLPGRNVRRVNTYLTGGAGRRGGLRDASGRAVSGDGLESIKVLRCQRDRYVDAGFFGGLLQKMKGLEVLDLTGDISMTPQLQEIEVLALQHTSIQLVRLHGRYTEGVASALFKSSGSIECIDWSEGAVARLHRDGKRSQNLVWRCKPRDIWLADWKTDSYVNEL